LWVIATLASLAVLIILILYIPVDVALRVDVYGRPKFGMNIGWLFGLVDREVSKGEKKPKEEKKQPDKGKAKTKKKRINTRAILKILRTKGLLTQFLTLLRDIFRQFKIGNLEANFRIGFDNPANTGLLFAFIGPVMLFLSRPLRPQIRIEPSFEAVCEGYLYGTIRLRPLQLVTPFLRFAFSLPAMRTAKTLVLTTWKREK